MAVSEVIVPIEASFDDERGSIQLLHDGSLGSAAVITSKKGSVRANHYHKTDWHYCYVLSGQIEYHHRPHGREEVAKVVVIDAGEMFFTPPMVDHAMKFLADTTFITLGRNSRAQESYESGIERVELIPS